MAINVRVFRNEYSAPRGPSHQNTRIVQVTYEYIHACSPVALHVPRLGLQFAARLLIVARACRAAGCALHEEHTIQSTWPYWLFESFNHMTRSSESRAKDKTHEEVIVATEFECSSGSNVIHYRYK